MQATIMLFRSIDKKVNTLLNTFGLQLGVIAQHFDHPGFRDLHTALVEQEAQLRFKQAPVDALANEFLSQTASFEVARRNLAAENALVVGHLELAGNANARAMYDSDKNDDATMAEHLIEMAGEVPFVGKGLVAALSERRKVFLAARASMLRESMKLDQQVKAYNVAFGRAQGEAQNAAIVIQNAGYRWKPARQPRKKRAVAMVPLLAASSAPTFVLTPAVADAPVPNAAAPTREAAAA